MAIVPIDTNPHYVTYEVIETIGKGLTWRHLHLLHVQLIDKLPTVTVAAMLGIRNGSSPVIKHYVLFEAYGRQIAWLETEDSSSGRTIVKYEGPFLVC